jgi:pimeloyl-ACP methyl ester carboxylesterase
MQEHRAIVLMSGMGTSPSEWDAVMPALSAYGPVVTIMPATGSVILVGHSEGGVRALRTAAAQPDRVDAVVVASGFFPPARGGRPVAAAALEYGRHRLAYVREVARRDRRPRPTRRGAGQLAALARLGLRPAAFRRLAAAVRCPVLVIHGDQDHVVPIAFARAAAAEHPAWTLRELSGAGHHPHRDRPDEWAAAVTEWIGLPA